MITEARQIRIMELINENNIVYTRDLVKEFEISRESIRRDLTALEEKGFLRKVYGGAVKIEKENEREDASSFLNRTKNYCKEKKEIAEKVCSYVQEGNSIAMDSSTTNLVIIEELLKNFDSLTIITNSFPIAEKISVKDNFKLIFTGGFLNKEEQCTCGNHVEKMLKNYHPDLYFMSCYGISAAGDITDTGEDNLLVKNAMRHVSNKTILVTPHQRFDFTSLLSVCKIKEVYGVVTDSGISEETVRKYEKTGIKFL